MKCREENGAAPPVSGYEQKTLCLFLGRILADRGFRDLFERDPQLAAEKLRVELTPGIGEKLVDYLAKLNSAGPERQKAISSRLNSSERWYQK